jgi:hypothetical protein
MTMITKRRRWQRPKNDLEDLAIIFALKEAGSEHCFRGNGLFSCFLPSVDVCATTETVAELCYVWNIMSLGVLSFVEGTEPNERARDESRLERETRKDSFDVGCIKAFWKGAEV